jgi:eukaryotic-like serine/threonine-protein kinase
MAERQFGPYRLVRQIAVGGMAEIHLAKTSGIAGFEKYVALKMIHPNFAEDDQFIQMLVDEAKIAVQLTHGNIAQTFDLGRVGDTYYITMEYVDGADLYKILRRASEQDYEMPLDVCAFIGKEIASALDHAHRKRDHTGRPLGIVHRDVSPQNVLISYSGEVKLVDFGIAKATMKARQTAVGVIKGKYYYMSPEQAWGDPIDFRSDIFSAGIVLYEMLTGQMLYLEEDLHKLLDMARRADIAPPSKLRKGIPPQLERIVMHALQKVPGERYQSAGDFATDLERFLHTYSPVFTAGKISALIKHVLGDPAALAPPPALAQHPSGVGEIELRDGAMATMTIDDAELAHASDRDYLRDENSVIFRVAELRPTQPPSKQPAPARPRGLHEETRQLVGVPPAGHDEASGLLSVAPPPPAAGRRASWDSTGTDPGDDLDNIGEQTIITGGSGGFMMDVAGEDGVDATIVSSGPPQPDVPHDRDPGDGDTDDEEGPTLTRDSASAPRVSRSRVQPPPALAANIHAPAVSELRKPRASRKTPGAGVNVLQQIVSSQGGAPMPAPPRPAPPPVPQPAPSPQFPSATPAGQPAATGFAGGYAADASGLPLGIPTPPSGIPAAPPHHQPYQYAHGAPGYPPAMSPGAFYPMHPPPMPMTLTAQMRLFEVDELPSQYRLGAARRRWFSYIIAAVMAISVAAIATFLIIRMTREAPDATVGAIVVESVPPGADVYYDGTRLAGTTPLTIEQVPLNSRHEIRVELDRHKPHVETIDVVRAGADGRVMALLKPVTGKLVVNSRPGGAEIRINDVLRGRTPTTISDIDIATARTLELRLKDYQPHVVDLTWPSNGQIDLDIALTK